MPRRAGIRSLVAVLDRRIAEVEAQMTALIAAEAGLAALHRRLQAVPGVGPVVAATLLTELPGLDRRDRRRFAALAALAPIARGRRQARRRRAIGGVRPPVRTMLHIAALHAFRRCALFKASRRDRLESAGTPAKAAITATARTTVAVPPGSPPTPTAATRC